MGKVAHYPKHSQTLSLSSLSRSSRCLPVDLHLAGAIVGHEAERTPERLLHQMAPLLRRPGGQVHRHRHALWGTGHVAGEQKILVIQSLSHSDGLGRITKLINVSLKN